MPGVVENVLSPFVTLSYKVWSQVPAILGGLLLLLVGSFIGRWLRSVVKKVLKMAKLDDYTAKVGASEILYKLGVGRSPTNIIGFLTYWLIFLAFLLSAANAVQLTVVSEFLQQVVLFMPKLIAAVVILGGGVFLGHFCGGIVLNAASANKLKGSEALSRVTYGIVVIFAVIMALQRLGIDTSILSNSIQIVIGCLGAGLALAIGLAFGLAGKNVAEGWIQGWIKKK